DFFQLGVIYVPLLFLAKQRRHATQAQKEKSHGQHDQPFHIAAPLELEPTGEIEASHPSSVADETDLWHGKMNTGMPGWPRRRLTKCYGCFWPRAQTDCAADSGYFPGCSLDGTARRKVLRFLEKVLL